MARPNIVYLHSHDTGRYCQPYGHAIPTPHLQRLAEQGVLFRQCFTANPTCSASRAALVTGESPHNNGMLGLAHRGWSLTDYGHHIVHTLRTAGYTSHLCGVQHVAKGAERIGYDDILSTQGPAKHVAPVAAEFLKGKPQEPFFISVGFNDTHREYSPPGPAEDERYCMPPAPFPDTAETRRDMAAYKASARELDDGFGIVLDALDEAGLAGNTLVICTTDHGIAFPSMKCNLTDHGCGVFLVMRGPGGFTGGKACDALVSHIDLFPTICDLLEIARPAWLQGKSLLPLIRGETDEVNDAVFLEVTYHAAYEPMRGVRTKRWKYIRRFGERAGKTILPNCDDSITKDLWLAHGWRERPVATEQLYDLVFDPHETHNLAADPAHKPVLDDLRERLDAWMRETDDPLLKGDIPAPEGAKVNDPDGLSPNEPVCDA